MITTNSYHMTWKLRATCALVLALAVSTLPAAFSRAVKAQTPAKATAEAPTKATASTSAESKGGPKEGIKVHGHWTIDVRNPDGERVTHREFENAVLVSGGNVLALILGRQGTVGKWVIALNNTVVGSRVCGPDSAPQPCILFETNSSLTILPPPLFQFKTLTLGIMPNQGLVLSGSATATRLGSINHVSTSNFPCSSDLSPATNCDEASSVQQGMTGTTLALPVNVNAGQIIQVTVVISFS